MPQELISQFDRKIAMPIETFRQVQTINLRDAIPTNIRWEGMIVYVMSEKLSYVLVGGLSNSQWVDLGTLVNVTVRDNLTSTSTTDALSANQGRVLKNLIDAIPTGGGIWGSITGTLSDQTDLQNALNGKQSLSQKGQANGYAQLDSGSKVPLSILPDSILGQVSYQGTWNPATNTPALVSPTTSATKGHYYVCTTSGTRFGLNFNTGDWVISNGVIWDKVDNTDAVTTVFGRMGNIVANAGDYTFAQIGSKPTTIAGYGITDFNSLGDARWVGISGDESISGLKNFIGAKLQISSGVPVLEIRRTTGALNEKNIYQINNGSTFQYRFYSDDYSSFTVPLQINRSGTTVTGIVMGGDVTAPSFKTTNWEIVETGGVLQFKQGGVTRFQMKSTGVIEATNFKLGLV